MAHEDIRANRVPPPNVGSVPHCARGLSYHGDDRHFRAGRSQTRHSTVKRHRTRGKTNHNEIGMEFMQVPFQMVNGRCQGGLIPMPREPVSQPEAGRHIFIDHCNFRSFSQSSACPGCRLHHRSRSLLIGSGSTRTPAIRCNRFSINGPHQARSCNMAASAAVRPLKTVGHC